MRVDIPYGTGFLPIHVNEPIRASLITPMSVTPQNEPSKLIHDSIAQYGQFTKIAKSMDQSSTFAIVVDSPELSPNSPSLLNAILSSLKSLAVTPNLVTIIVTSSVYSSRNIGALDELLGSPTLADYALVVHNPDDVQTLREIGKTNQSTPISLNSHYVDADYRITAGTVLQDVFRSATGGGSSILPGISGMKTISRNQKLMATKEIGSFNQDSLVFSNIVEAAQMCIPDVNVSIVEDWKSSIAHISIGGIITSWKEAIKAAQRIATIQSIPKADIGLVGAGGNLHDSTLCDALTALATGYSITRQGGTIILMAECPDGPGPDGFIQSVSSAKSENDVVVNAEIGFQSGMERARLLWQTLGSRNLILCSRIRSSLVSEKLHCTPVQDPNDGLEIAIRNHGSNCQVAILPNASRTYLE